MPSIDTDFLYQYLLVVVIVVIFLLERFFVTLSFRREMQDMRKESYMLRGEFTKLAVLLQAALMNRKFSDAPSSTDTQTMVSIKEWERLQQMEKMWQDEQKREIEKMLRYGKADEPKERRKSSDDDDAIFFDGGNFR